MADGSHEQNPNFFQHIIDGQEDNSDNEVSSSYMGGRKRSGSENHADSDQGNNNGSFEYSSEGQQRPNERKKIRINLAAEMNKRGDPQQMYGGGTDHYSKRSSEKQMDNEMVSTINMPTPRSNTLIPDLRGKFSPTQIKSETPITYSILRETFPNRFFILKTFNEKQMEVLQKQEYCITKLTNKKKLQDAFQNAENVYIIIMSVDAKQFFGYCKMISDTHDTKDLPEDILKFFNSDAGSLSQHCVFKIEWKAQNKLAFASTSHLNNAYNQNRNVHMCKEANEVDLDCAKKLVELLENPPKEIPAEVIHPTATPPAGDIPIPKNAFRPQMVPQLGGVPFPPPMHPHMMMNAMQPPMSYFPYSPPMMMNPHSMYYPPGYGQQSMMSMPSSNSFLPDPKSFLKNVEKKKSPSNTKAPKSSSESKQKEASSHSEKTSSSSESDSKSKSPERALSEHNTEKSISEEKPRRRGSYRHGNFEKEKGYHHNDKRRPHLPKKHKTTRERSRGRKRSTSRHKSKRPKEESRRHKSSKRRKHSRSRSESRNRSKRAINRSRKTKEYRRPIREQRERNYESQVKRNQVRGPRSVSRSSYVKSSPVRKQSEKPESQREMSIERSAKSSLNNRDEAKSPFINSDENIDKHINEDMDFDDDMGIDQKEGGDEGLNPSNNSLSVSPDHHSGGGAEKEELVSISEPETKKRRDYNTSNDYPSKREMERKSSYQSSNEQKKENRQRDDKKYGRDRKSRPSNNQRERGRKVSEEERSIDSEGRKTDLRKKITSKKQTKGSITERIVRKIEK